MTFAICTTLLVASWAIQWQDQEPEPSPPLQAEPSPPEENGPPMSIEAIQEQVPDIGEAEQLVGTEDLEEQPESEQRRKERFLNRLGKVAEPTKLFLSLEEARTRALMNNYSIRVDSYNPAIETTRVVEAESAFDAIFFLNIIKDRQGRPSSSPTLTGTTSDTFSTTGGLRKLLPTGMQVTTSYSITRSASDSAFQLLNPSWFSQLQVEMRQPLLRGFGLDFNRSQIRIAKLNRKISNSAFHRTVQDTLVAVEQAYWELVRARRDVVITARLLAEFEQIYDHLYARKDFDVVPIQLSETEARLEANIAGFVRVLNNVRNAEDRLIALMNDPSITLVGDVEIIPTEFPVIEPLVVDKLGEVQTALDERPELHEAQWAIDSAKLVVGAQKVAALPRADLVFRYSVDGLGASADRSFDEVTKNDFHEYYVAFEFDIPVGNRGPRAALARSRLQFEKAVNGLQQVIETVILDVNTRVREMQTTYDQIVPTLKSTVAAEKQVASIVARAERKDFTQLNAELNARQSLANSRRTLLQSAIDYNLAISELERSKGTLLRYYNVIITDEDESNGWIGPTPLAVGD